MELPTNRAPQVAEWVWTDDELLYMADFYRWAAENGGDPDLMLDSMYWPECDGRCQRAAPYDFARMLAEQEGT